MKTLITIAVVAIAAILPAYAQQDADALVASKRAANMTYRELMQTFSHALGAIQDGVIRQNEELVKQGANVILTHPAPKEKPWSIMATSDQKGFQQALLAYDRVLDTMTSEVVKAANLRNWQEGIDAVGRLQGACVGCHHEWMHKAQR